MLTAVTEAVVIELLTLRREVTDAGLVLWFNTENQLHREYGPAFEGPDGTRMWYRQGLLHRTDGPAIEWASDGKKQWFLMDKSLSEEEFNAIREGTS